MAAATPIIETELPAIRALELRVDPLVLRAAGFEIVSQDVYMEAADFLRDCKTLQKEIRDTTEETIRKAYEAHKAATALRAKFLEPVDKAEKLVKSKMGLFVEAQERLALEQKRMAERAARKLEEERRMREAEELEARGMPEAAEDVISAPIALPAIPEAPKPIAEGTSSRKKYATRVVDLNALIRAAAEGRIPAGLVIANQSALDSLARSLGESFSMPGCELVVETVISAKGR